MENLANENVCQLLILGDLYNAERLQERAVQVSFTLCDLFLQLSGFLGKKRLDFEVFVCAFNVD